MRWHTANNRRKRKIKKWNLFIASLKEFCRTGEQMIVALKATGPGY
jgi:hypothetical protein